MRIVRSFFIVALALFSFALEVRAADPCIEHAFESARSDSGDASLVQPSNWNDCHVAPGGVNAQTGTTYTVQSSDFNKLVTFTNASAIAVTLPQAGASSVFLSKWYADFQNRGAGTVTITPTTSTIDGSASLALTTGQGVRIFSDGTNYFSQRGIGLTDHGGLSGLSDDDHSAINVKYESSAGTPAAGSCDRAGQIQFDTTNTLIYSCFSNGGNPVDIGTQGDAVNQVCFDADCETASGSDTLKITSTSGLITNAGVSLAANVITVDLDIADHVKSIYLPANALTTDGTQCANPALATINSGPRIYTIICADNDASTIFAHLVMPDSWNAGTFTVELEYLQTAADTNAMHSDVAGQCRGAGETVNNTWGTEIAIDDAAVSGSNIVDHTTSAAITANGTCAAGDTLFIRWQLDATGTTTAAATLHILGMKIEYTVNGSGSD